MVLGFTGLILLSVTVYNNAPPIPTRAIAPDGEVVFTADDISDGQAVFLKYGLMNNGTIWGHGGMLGPDFSAQTLHNLGLFFAGRIARERFGVAYTDLDRLQKGTVEGEVAALFKTNTFDPASGTLPLPEGGKEAFADAVRYWTDYFKEPATNGGLAREAVRNADELRQLTAFFVWTAWASAVQRPGTTHSYTNNFPYDPLVGNHPTGDTVLWSAVSLLFLLGGIGIVLLAFGKFDYLGWHGGETHGGRKVQTAQVTPAQTALLKFMVVAAALFLTQALVGGALAHYRAEPGDFYGFDLSVIFPSNLLRGWHLQLAIFWVATSYMGGALYVAAALAGKDPKWQQTLINILFGALVLVVVGSLLGQWAGIKNLLGDVWFWFGNQGWEYLEIGRFWQVLLVAGMLFWFWLVLRAVLPIWDNPTLKPFVTFFLIAAFAIPFFYLPAFFFGPKTHFTIVDVWRFWIIHLWVEGFFEFFITVIVALIFFQLGIVRRITALRVIYLDAILYFVGGLIGTAHHWYFTGQTPLAMALGATFSALEVVPLTLLTLDAWDFYKVTRGDVGASGFRHRWTFFFLMAVGFWNFIGAGVFGFLINMPIVSYYEVGTTLTVNHGHAAFVGVFGMLAVGLMAYVLREVTSDVSWSRVEPYLKVSFWGLNIGLAMMVGLSLLPNGLLQVWDVIANGYRHARSIAHTGSELPKLLEWMRTPGDLVFIFVGTVPLLLSLWFAYLDLLRKPPRVAVLREGQVT
ncbi:MAG: cbb3-type cytochrome c oxidase subunit I [Alphaproteobacteria bacterium]|nr:cbb3-type cytochrome c oxidase subunit I [Alphaproteobacteria bacterium]